MYHFDYLAVFVSWSIYWLHLHFISCRSTKKCPRKKIEHLAKRMKRPDQLTILVQGIPQLHRSWNLLVSWWPLLEVLSSEEGWWCCVVACCMSARGCWPPGLFSANASHKGLFVRHELQRGLMAVSSSDPLDQGEPWPFSRVPLTSTGLRLNLW
jgi:hypothetical protein